MITPDDLISTVMTELDIQIMEVYGRSSNRLDKEITAHDNLPSQWMAAIQLTRLQESHPITFYLNLQYHLLPSCLEPSQARASCDLAAKFSHQVSQYGYWDGRWYRNGQRCPAELPERLHPLACLAATTVDITTASVKSWERLQTRGPHCCCEP